MNNRRLTLGGISPSQLNARGSTGAGRSLLDTKLTKTTGRPSLAPNTASRRSSTYGKQPVSGVKNDPRPIGDKAYQQNCIRTILTYLQEHGYDPSIGTKQLTSPTSKDYANIVQFLFRQVDPNLVKNFGKVLKYHPNICITSASYFQSNIVTKMITAQRAAKLEEEVPMVYKRLKYPFQLSKSALFAVGSPHTWPSLLAALAWLVELLNYQEKVDNMQTQVFDDKQKCDADFFEYAATSYRYFLAGDDNTCSAVDAEKHEDFKQRGHAIRQTMAATKQTVDSLRAQLQALREQQPPLVLAEERRNQLLHDRGKFQNLVENLQSHKQSQERKLQEREADLKSKQEQMEVAEQELEEVKQRVNSQTINRADVTRMHNEKAKQEEILLSVTSQREALDSKVHEQEVQVERRLDDMDTLIQEYHSLADRLQLIPASAKRAEGLQYEVKLDRAATAANDLLSVDLKGTIKPAVQRLRDLYIQKARTLSEEVLSLAEKLDASQEQVTERAEENALLDQQVRKLEQQAKQAKDAMEATVKSTSAEADRLQVEVEQLRNAASHGVSESEAEVAAVQQELEQLTKSCEAHATQLQQELSLALELFMQHKQHFAAKLVTLQKDAAEAKNIVQQAHAAFPA